MPMRTMTATIIVTQSGTIVLTMMFHGGWAAWVSGSGRDGVFRQAASRQENLVRKAPMPDRCDQRLGSVEILRYGGRSSSRYRAIEELLMDSNTKLLPAPSSWLFLWPLRRTEKAKGSTMWGECNLIERSSRREDAVGSIVAVVSVLSEGDWCPLLELVFNLGF